MPSQGLAATGTALVIQQFKHLESGRMLVSSRGLQRYRVRRVLQESPVLLCEVEWLVDVADVARDDDLPLEELAGDVRTLFETTLQLSNKQQGDTRTTELADELGALSPVELSFWLMRIFQEHPSQQQNLLDSTSTRERLTSAQTVLRETCSYLSATSALKVR